MNNYQYGFAEKCAAYSVDADELVKFAMNFNVVKKMLGDKVNDVGQLAAHFGYKGDTSKFKAGDEFLRHLNTPGSVGGSGKTYMSWKDMQNHQPGTAIQFAGNPAKRVRAPRQSAAPAAAAPAAAFNVDDAVAAVRRRMMGASSAKSDLLTDDELRAFEAQVANARKNYRPVKEAPPAATTTAVNPPAATTTAVNPPAATTTGANPQAAPDPDHAGGKQTADTRGLWTRYKDKMKTTFGDGVGTAAAYGLPLGAAGTAGAFAAHNMYGTGSLDNLDVDSPSAPRGYGGYDSLLTR